MKKRGLSDVVTTLIIVLLVLVAIGIIWVVVKNVIQKGSEQIEIGQFSLDLQIKSVNVQGDDVTIGVDVKRNPGQGNFVGMNFVFSDGQNSETIRQNITLQELEEKSFTFTLTKINVISLKTVSIAPIYKLDSGKESTGNVLDNFDVPKNISTGTGTGLAVVGGKFAALGYGGTGSTTYTVESNSGIYPQFKNVVIDPLDVQIGNVQILTTTVYSPNGVVNVTTTTQLDNEILNFNLVKTSESSGTSTWTINWTVYDTHEEVYRTTFFATDGTGNQNNVTLTWTDACSFTHNGESRISIPCTVNSLEGGDASDIVVDGVGLTLGSGGNLVFTPGYSVSKPGSGSIIKSGGSIQKGYLYYYDADSDGSRDSGSYIFNTSATGNLTVVRAKDSTTVVDCYPSNENAYPGQTAYFIVDRGDGSYDYNCDENQDQETSYGSSTCTVGPVGACSAAEDEWTEGWDGTRSCGNTLAGIDLHCQSTSNCLDASLSNGSTVNIACH